MKLPKIVALVFLSMMTIGAVCAQTNSRIPIRDPLGADRTYYVRTDGDDANSGLLDDASGAFRTIQRAIHVVCEDLDLGGFDVLIQVRTGTYNEEVLLESYVGAGAVTLRGDTTTPTNVVIAPTTGCAISAYHTPRIWRIEGFRLTSTNSNLSAWWGSHVEFGFINFGPATQHHITVGGNSTIIATGSYSISGGAVTHITADHSGSISTIGRAVTLTNTPQFSWGFVQALRCGNINAAGMTFSGAATGARYRAFLNGAIDTNLGGANFFPGNAAGVAWLGGQYN